MYVGMKNHMKTEGLEGKWCFKSYPFSQKHEVWDIKCMMKLCTTQLLMGAVI